MSMKAAALQLAEIGYSVIPCNINKSPMTKNGYKDASRDPVIITQWWTNNPHALIGAPTGKGAGFFVLDIDQPHGPNSLKALEQEHGSLPVTAEQRTGGGGRHLFFKAPETTIRNSAGKIGTGIDIRGDGGYTIMSPSVHSSGNRYEWTNSEPMVEAPPWLIDRAVGKPNRKESRQTDVVATPYGQRALADELSDIVTTPEGSRNHRLNQSAFSLGQLVSGGELDHGQVESSLFAAALGAGLSEKEATRTISSGMSAGMDQPRNAAMAMFKDVRLLSDVTEGSLPTSVPAQQLPLVEFLSFNEMVNRPVQTEWLIKGFLTQRSINLLFGETGSMKSFLAIDVGLCIATGTEWHGHAVKQSGPVFYICGEGFAGVSKRLKAWKVKHEGAER